MTRKQPVNRGWDPKGTAKEQKRRAKQRRAPTTLSDGTELRCVATGCGQPIKDDDPVLPLPGGGHVHAWCYARRPR